MYYSVLELLQKTAAELELSPPATVVSNTDSTVIQLLNLASALGEELATTYDWTTLQTETTFSTVVDQSTYQLPADFARVINNTLWNKTRNQPIIGGTTPAQYQFLASRSVSAIRYTYRLRGTELTLLPTPTAVETIGIEYMSAAFVYDVTTSSYKRSFTKDSDKVAFDDRLFINGLKLKFKEASGFECNALAFDYESMLSALKGADGGAQVINLNRRASNPTPFIQDGNWKP